MKTFKFFTVIFLMLLSLSCEKEEDITGDSGLKIINDCSVGIRIYFDDSYIGRVESDESETWAVPSGTHTVKATCSFYDDWEKSLSFTTGITKVVRIEVAFKGTSLIEKKE